MIPGVSMIYLLFFTVISLASSGQDSLTPALKRQRGGRELIASVQVCIIIPPRMTLSADSVVLDSITGGTLKRDASRSPVQHFDKKQGRMECGGRIGVLCNFQGERQ
jgi:hypothetical protein